MDIIELFIDEEDEVSGIEAVSIVESPAIESDFIALKNQEFKFAEVNKEKRILMGAALIPNKPIYRKERRKRILYLFSVKILFVRLLNYSLYVAIRITQHLNTMCL